MENKEIYSKDMVIDSILYNIKNTLETLNHKLLLNLSVEIYKNNNLIDLFVNNIKVNTTEFNYSLSEKECYYLKNTILYLIHDYTDTENININFYIN